MRARCGRHSRGRPKGGPAERCSTLDQSLKPSLIRSHYPVVLLFCNALLSGLLPHGARWHFWEPRLTSYETWPITSCVRQSAASLLRHQPAFECAQTEAVLTIDPDYHYAVYRETDGMVMWIRRNCHAGHLETRGSSRAVV